MPRKPRFNLPGIPQHVIQRGNNRDPRFFAVGQPGKSKIEKEAAAYYVFG